MTWTDRAACRGADPRIFYPGGTARAKDAARSAAQALCASCPVQRQCKAEGIAHREHGVWGGVDLDARWAASKPKRTRGANVPRPRRPPPIPH